MEKMNKRMNETSNATIAGRKPKVLKGKKAWKKTTVSPPIMLAIHPHFVAFFQYNVAMVAGNKTTKPENVVLTNVPIIPVLGL